jgi:glutathione synthase/RimK-type ligase-like ATP-grasp enzyme
MKSKSKKKFVSVRSRHPSHSVIRRKIETDHNVVFRLGSTTPTSEVFKTAKNVVEINTVQAITNSANKLLMKRKFSEAGVLTADWWNAESLENWAADKFPIVVKHIFGSRNNGNTLIKTPEELNAWLNKKSNTQLTQYIVERFYNYNREYRLHVTADGCFYTCRKMLKSDTPAEKRWFRNDSNSTWILEENENFDKPSNWTAIVAECVKALNAVGLDVGAIDLRVQSREDQKGNNKKVIRKDPKFIVIEINSAPSFGELTAVKYLDVIPKIIKSKTLTF